ncbi:hypothetical protein KAR91_57290 [Candidatus Pacearchaeota archaeon]|nr:hypothetical protein [Candidatus Pacearchaeota archaeon]
MKQNLIYWINELADAKRDANHNGCTGNLIAVRDIYKKIGQIATEIYQKGQG